jgi:TonB family protein
MIKSLLFALMLQTAANNYATPQVITPLTPVGKWTVNGSDNQCTLSHDFGNESAKTVLNIIPGVLGESFRIIVLVTRRDGEPISGKATITLSPNQQRRMTVPFRQTDIDGERAAAIMKGFGGADWYFAETSRIQIDLAGRLVDLAPPDIDQALAVLRQCQNQLLDSWGITPAERKFIGPIENKDRAYAIGNPDEWISFHDYPSEALAAHEEGSVTILWTIGIDGHVHDCRVIKSSGVPLLDAAACTAVTDRGRYRPVLDETGKPMVLHAFREVNWHLPR